MVGRRVPSADVSLTLNDLTKAKAQVIDLD